MNLESISGTVRFDGIDIRDMEKDSMRANMNFKISVATSLRARENIAMGKVSKISDDGAIMEAADKAGAGELIRQLPPCRPNHCAPRRHDY